MRYYLSEGAVLKRLETPSVYMIRTDELYELDEKAFSFLSACASPQGAECAEGEAEFIDCCLTEEIVSTAPKDLRRPPVRQSPVPSLRYLELQITDRCNLKCRHCYIGKPKNRELTVPEIRSVLDEFEEMQGLRLLITGGEPLIHPHFLELNDLLPGYGFRKILFTNGLLLTEEGLKSLHVDEIQFSVDGMEHGHESLRGKGSFRQVMKKIEAALRTGMEVSIATMVHRENLQEFDDMESFFRQLGIRDWTVDVPCPSGNMLENPILRLSPETGGKYLRYGFGDGLHGGGEGFACGHHLISVLADGSIAKCAFYGHDPVGTIQDGLLKAWLQMHHIRLAELECSDLSCPHLESCRGGCRYRASVSGGERGRDLYRCSAYDIMEMRGQVAPEKP
ncbi:MAG: radical SAM protein [Nitrospirales bacterium]|nr:radical SAM protein [Nitrospirales bacterium]